MHGYVYYWGLMKTDHARAMLIDWLHIYIYIWDSVQLNHPYGTFSKFPEQAKESNARIEMYG